MFRCSMVRRGRWGSLQQDQGTGGLPSCRALCGSEVSPVPSPLVCLRQSLLSSRIPHIKSLTKITWQENHGDSGASGADQALLRQHPESEDRQDRCASPPLTTTQKLCRIPIRLWAVKPGRLVSTGAGVDTGSVRPAPLARKSAPMFHAATEMHGLCSFVAVLHERLRRLRTLLQAPRGQAIFVRRCALRDSASATLRRKPTRSEET